MDPAGSQDLHPGKGPQLSPCGSLQRRTLVTPLDRAIPATLSRTRQYFLNGPVQLAVLQACLDPLFCTVVCDG